MVLDCSCGIGTQAVGLALRGHRVVGTDLSARAAARAAREGTRRSVPLVTAAADMRRLPFADARFDAVVCADNSLPHLLTEPDVRTALTEMRRVLRPAGRLVVLEFSRPEGRVLGGLYALYLSRVLPRIGDRISGHDGPYRYLARTIATFPTPAELAHRMRDAGFDACSWTTRTRGIVTIHTALRTR